MPLFLHNKIDIDERGQKMIKTYNTDKILSAINILVNGDFITSFAVMNGNYPIKIFELVIAC